MQEIAYTTFGRNAFFTGLISHVAALLVAMLSASGTEHFFGMVFLLACSLFVVGAYVELKNRGYSPLKDWRFYVIAAVTVFPLLGPFIVLGLLYSFQKNGQEKRVGLSGLFPAIFRLKANVLIVFLLIVILFILFVFTNSQDDPYYKKRYRNHQNKNLQQSLLDTNQYGHCVGKRDVLC